MMRILMTIMLVALITAGCRSGNDTDQPVSRFDVPPVSMGESYQAVRGRLIVHGWTPLPAVCTRQSNRTCFGKDEPELATDMDTDDSCGFFTKQGKRLKVCIAAVKDAEPVSSIALLYR